jgi:hypothetical protein
MQGRLIRKPSDRVGLTTGAPPDLESVNGRNRGRTQLGIAALALTVAGVSLGLTVYQLRSQRDRERG